MKLPRRFGKENVIELIRNQDGKATPLQEMMLSLNDLKNTYTNLNQRAIQELFSENPVIKDKECQFIKMTIDDLVNKLSNYTIRSTKPKKNKVILNGFGLIFLLTPILAQFFCCFN